MSATPTAMLTGNVRTNNCMAISPPALCPASSPKTSTKPRATSHAQNANLVKRKKDVLCIVAAKSKGQNSTSGAVVRWNCPLCGDFNVLNLACTYRHWQAVHAQAFKVKDYGRTHFELDFCNGGPGSHAPGQIRGIRRVISFCFFDNDCVAYSTSLESSLFEYAVQSTRRQIIAGFSGNSDATRPARVLELPMTSSYRDQIPAVALKQSEDRSHLGQPEFMEGQNCIT